MENIKKIIIHTVSALVCIWSIFGCGKASVTEVERAIFVDHQSLSLFVNDEVKITASPTDENFDWVSENTSVATVSASGVVHAAGEGETNIIVSYGDVKRTIPVSVVIKIPATGITVSKYALELKPRESVVITSSLIPENSNDKVTVVWRSADPSMVKVTNGVVETLKEGITTLYVLIEGKSASEIAIPIEVSYTFPFNGPHIISAATPCLIQARDFDTGGFEYAFFDTSTSTGTPNYRPDIPSGERCPYVEGGTHIGYVADGEWLQYTVDVRDAGDYTVDSELGIGSASVGKYHFEVDGFAYETASVPAKAASDGWGVFVWLSVRDSSLELPVIHLTEGRHKIRFFVNTATYNIRAFKFTHQ